MIMVAFNEYTTIAAVFRQWKFQDGKWTTSMYSMSSKRHFLRTLQNRLIALKCEKK